MSPATIKHVSKNHGASIKRDSHWLYQPGLSLLCRKATLHRYSIILITAVFCGFLGSSAAG